MVLFGNDLTAKSCFIGNYADTVFSKNNKYALVGELIPKVQDQDDVPPICGHQSRSPMKVNVKLLKNVNGCFELANSYKLETGMFFCSGKDCKIFITNDGRYVVKEIREYAPVHGESFISVSWDVFKLKEDRVVECKVKGVFLNSLRLFDLLALYPNERLRFMKDYTQFDRNIKSEFFLSIDVNENIDLQVRYYSVKERKYIDRETTVFLDDLCFQVDYE